MRLLILSICLSIIFADLVVDEDTGCCEADDGCPEGCVEDVSCESYCVLDTADGDDDCDNSDEDKWVLDYLGSSTQFRYINPCDKSFIKIKMEDLTEWDAGKDKKTGNKETSFASAKGWEWEDEGGVVKDYNGQSAIYNKYIADELTQAAASFTLETIFFVENVDNEFGNATYPQYTLKFSTTITGWEYENDDNYLVLCIGIMTNNGGKDKSDKKEDKENDVAEWQIDGFVIDNDEIAQCDGDDISVDINPGGNGNNHLDLCYTFDPCGGDISYDPTILFGSANQLNSFITFIVILFVTIFI